MAKEPPKKESDSGDDTKRDQVLKRLLGTPHMPHKKGGGPKAPAAGKKKGDDQ